MLEKEIEQALIRAVRKSGGLCLKFVSPGWDGAPDRICLWSGGRVAFIELKRPGGKVMPLQKKRMEELRKLGFDVKVIDSLEDAYSLGGSADAAHDLGGSADA